MTSKFRIYPKIGCLTNLEKKTLNSSHVEAQLFPHKKETNECYLIHKESYTNTTRIQKGTPCHAAGAAQQGVQVGTYFPNPTISKMDCKT